MTGAAVEAAVGVDTEAEMTVAAEMTGAAEMTEAGMTTEEIVIEGVTTIMITRTGETAIVTVIEVVIEVGIEVDTAETTREEVPEVIHGAVIIPEVITTVRAVVFSLAVGAIEVDAVEATLEVDAAVAEVSAAVTTGHPSLKSL